ncbi:alpha/beta hydrolase [Streptomyces albus subsp. chlorinus]|uniref:alpha/beta fold hydrolase n=1 Tax=Streptomyces albus TaxID=1888 RepID=UPI00156F4925|nr:alpha/beta fold hydrolase [Streptomyces albus]NSC21945.1 alpha/beta hydrolase [Streptomyces albus subsp. chlorinus]
MSARGRGLRPRTIVLATLAAAACATALPAVASADLTAARPAAHPTPDSPRGTLTWGSCDRPDMPVQKGVQCGTLRVPVDWSEPRSGTVALRAYRFKAADPAKKKGTILNFPSGPGETGDLAFASLRKHLPGYDLIALDPRGVGQSGRLSCATDKILKIPYVPPTDGRRFRALEKNQRAFWKTCTTTPAGLKNHLDASSNARDAEALRKALRLERINLYGFSYGTLTAERYLGLYGDHVGGSVLEGVMNPAQSRREFVTTAARGMEAVFDRFREWCAEKQACALHGKDVASVFRKAQRTADAGRVPGSLMTTPWSSVTVTRYFELMAPRSFKETADGLAKLSRGENPMGGGERAGQGGQEPGQGGQEPGQGGTPKTTPYADPVVCSDFDLSVGSAGRARRDLAATRAAAPVLGFSTNSSNYTSICLGGPHPAEGSGKPVTSRSAHPTMLLSNTADPATPSAWADGVARQLGGKAVAVRTEKVGHGGGLDDPRTRSRVAAYLDRSNRPAR